MRLCRTDRNQAEIVTALRRVGCSVWVASHVGGGFPDLAVGRIVRGVATTYLLEVKDGSLPPSRRRLNEKEAMWHAGWLGHVAVVESIEQALEAVGLLPAEKADRG